jgi:hypothetical protein
MTINLNASPYYDDFQEDKNYLKILFNPSMAVQARELTQLQTSLQNQINKFGSHIFKDGSIVLNGQTSTNSVHWIDVSTTDASFAVNKRFVGATSDAAAIVVKVVQKTTTLARLYITYVTGDIFLQNEIINSEDGNQFPIVDLETYTGTATTYSIADSVFFVKGYFVFCESQTIVLQDNGTEITKKVGLNIVEQVITHNEDSTLLDPAQGSYNFAAPGADRFSITLVLSAYTFDPQEQGGETENFIELSRFQDSALIYNVTSASYSELETTLARRTYDESGDYTVLPFGLTVKDHIFGDANKLSLGIEPGKAYVKGYEFETISTINVDMDKARDTSNKNEYSVQVDYGTYFLVDTPAGTATIDYNGNAAVNLKNGGTVIGTANIKGIQYHTAGTYKLFVFNVVFTGANTSSNVTAIESASGWSAAIKTAATEYASGVYLIKNQRKPLLIPLPNSPIKTLKTTANAGLPETDYFAFKTFYPVTFTTGIATISGSTNENLVSGTATDYLVVFPNGTVKTISSVSALSGQSRTLTITDTTSTNNVSVFALVSLTSQGHKTKAKQVGTKTFATSLAATKVSLDKSDCISITSIIAEDNAVSGALEDKDVTAWFDFNNGQTDDLYDHGWVTIKSGITLPAAYDTLTVTFEYFTHTSTTGFFSVDSYIDAAIDYTQIPTYKASNGEEYNLRDCLDFRPRRADGGTTITGGLAAIPSQYVQLDYDYYLPRIDKLVLTKERKFDVIKGIPADFPAIPSDLYDAMTLYVINVPAYTENPKDVSYSYIDNRRYTMRDIGKIDKRVERMEYYTALSLLEKQAKDEAVYDNVGVERFKNGILVDSFSGHSVGDVNNPDYSCSIEPEASTLRPRFAPFSFNYVVNSLTNATRVGDLVTLPYTTEVFTEQPFVTGTVNLNPYMVFAWNGSVTLDPPTDTWIDTYTKPDVVVNVNGNNDVYTRLTDNVSNPASIGVRWNDWQTVNSGVVVSDKLSTNSSTSTDTTGGKVLQTTNTVVTNNQTTTTATTLQRSGFAIATSAVSTIRRDMGTRVVDTSIVPFIRSRIVHFAAKNLKPNTQLVASFDGIGIDSYCDPADEVIFSTPTVNRLATTFRTTNTTPVRSGKIILSRNDRIFVVMDAGSNMISAGNIVQWYINGVAQTGTSTVASVNSPTTLKTNEKGDVAGSFMIPNNSAIKFRTGERTFRLADGAGVSAGTAAECKYVASGMSQSVERTIIATKVASISVYPTTDTQTKTTTATKSIVVSNTSVTKDITPPPPPPPPQPPLNLSCDASQNGNGRTGRHDFVLELGTGTGSTGIRYNAASVPDRYTIIWDGKSYTSGFVGSSSHNDKLNALGLPNVTGSGSGSLLFNKNKATPTTARVIVDAPLTGTGWRFSVVCPAAAVPATVPETPPIVVSSTLSLQRSVNISSNRFNRSDVVSSRVTPVSGQTTWNANSTVSAAARYALTSITSSNPKITITPSFIGVATSKGTDRSFSVNVESGTKRSELTTNITSTWTYVSGDDNIPVGQRTLVRTTGLAFNIIPEPVRVDPVAQTFFVDAESYPNGIFIKSIDLYFKTKSTTAPITVQIRPTVNGYPSSSVIMPYGISVKDAADVSVSTTGLVPTNFEFANILHLAPGEYSFVALADSVDYEMYTATIGEFDINNVEQRVTSQGTLGSMFKSQNASTWTPVQEEDVKFRIHKCVFDTTITGSVVYNTDIADTHGDVSYDTFFTSGEVVDFADTNIDYFFKPNNQATWTPYQSGTNVEMSERKTLACATQSSLQYKTELKTTDRNITPIVDTNRLSSVLVQNIINNVSTGETASFGGSALSRYITRKVKLSPGFEATDLVLYVTANKPTSTDFKVYYKVSTASDSFFDDNEYVEMVLDAATPYSETGFSDYKFKTPYTLGDSNVAISSGDRFDTFAIKIVMLSGNTVKVPQFRDLRIIALDD